MEIKFTYKCEVYVTADNIMEAKEKFGSACLMGVSDVEGVTIPEFVKMIDIEDAYTNKNLWAEYYGY